WWADHRARRRTNGGSAPGAGAPRRGTPPTRPRVQPPADDSRRRGASVEGDQLPAVVRAAHVADRVRQLLLPALRTGLCPHRAGLPLRPARPGVAARHPALGYGHGALLLGPVLGQFQLLEYFPARVDPLVVAVVGRQVIPVCPTPRTQPRAVLPAQRAGRQCEHYRVPHGLLQVDQVALQPPYLVVLGGGVGGAVRVG